MDFQDAPSGTHVFLELGEAKVRDPTLPLGKTIQTLLKELVHHL